MFAREKKPESMIPHYQGIIWMERKLNNKEMVHYRNFNKKPFVRKSTKRGDGPVSFTHAKNIGSLAKYCNDKEGFGLIKTRNISENMLKKLGKWNGKKKRDKLRKELVEEFKKNFTTWYKANAMSYGYIPDMKGNYEDCYADTKARTRLKTMICEIAYDTFINTEFNPPMWRHMPNMLKKILLKRDYLMLVYNIDWKPVDDFEHEPYGEAES
jgi:hypothetical protein